MGMFGMGQPVLRTEDPRLLTGKEQECIRAVYLIVR